MAKKVLFIGIDGMDPILTENMMEEGVLPNFSGLLKNGYYSRLAICTPPQSPVAWTSIATGYSPSDHGVYDFLGRDKRNYLPNLSILRLEKTGYVTPFAAKPFWEKASERGIPFVVLRWPLTFPAKKATHGLLLSGLGTPDIQGKLGAYTFYTTNTDLKTENKKGRIVAVQCKNNRISTEIRGPFVASLTGMKEAAIPFEMELRDGYISCAIDSHHFDLHEGKWSEWLHLKFNVGLMRNIMGLCKFYLKSIAPEFNLYMTAINIAHATHSFPLSSPLNYSEKLSDKIGPYTTLGLPEDTNALNDGLIDEDAFLGFCNCIMDEREGMFFHELERFNEGIFACVFDTTDRIQHMFWRFLDAGHPMYDEKLASKYDTVIIDYYKRMDGIIGKALSMINSDTVLVICSDHGFSSFRKAVHLNTWLLENGFMELKSGETACEGLFDTVDWHKTKAYAVGLNSIYLNIKGRERNGIVNNKEICSVKQGLISKLKEFTDCGSPVVKQVYDTGLPFCESVGLSACQFDSRPDLIVGYERDYRQSWQTAVGAVPSGSIIEDNLKKWSGDHCCDASYVPGVLFTNQKVISQNPSVLDIAPFIMEQLADVRK